MPEAEDDRPEEDQGGEDARRDAEDEDDDSLSLMSASQVGIDIKASAAEAKTPPPRPPQSTLAGLLRELVKLPVSEALSIAKQIARELETTWDQEVVRVDIRPENIMVSAAGDVRMASPEEKEKPLDPALSADPVCDEHNYVSPEELKGMTIDGRADIYALGILLYRMVTGEFPFKGDDGESIARARLEGPPRPANEVNAEVPAELADVIDSMLAEHLSFRYPNPTEFLRDLELIAAKPSAAKPSGGTGTETEIMKKPDSEAKTPATGTPAVLAGGEEKTAAPVGSSEKGATNLLESDLWQEAEPPEQAPAKGPSPAKVSEADERAASEGEGPRKSRAAVAIAAAVGAGVLALVLVGVLLWTGEPDPDEAIDTPTPVPGVEAEAPLTERDDGLEAEADARYQELQEAYGEGDFRRVVDEIDSFGGKYAATRRAGRFVALRRMAADKLAGAAQVALLEEAAAAFYEARRSEYEAGEYQALVAKIAAAGEKYAATKHAGGIASLRDDAKKKLEEIARRAQVLAERESRYRKLVDRACEEIARGDHEAAFETLGQARALKDSDEVAELTKEAQRCRHVAQGRSAEEEGRLLEAVGLYRNALSMRPDAGLAARVVDLERGGKLQKLMAEAKARESANDWKAALDTYSGALLCAKGEERGPVELAIERVRSEMAYRGAVGKARAALESDEWPEAIASAQEALRIRPGDEEARGIIVAATKSMEPDKRITNSIGMSFVLVRGGEFLMGSTAGDPDEQPVHTVFLDSYYIGVHEVTNAQFEEFDPSRERTPFSPGDDAPVVLVSWHDAVDFCRWLNEKAGLDEGGKEGLVYRLPTEAEWEKAARGSDGRKYPWGGQAPGSSGAMGRTWRCNFGPLGEGRARRRAWHLDGHRNAARVGSYAEFHSPCGAQDMAGNVWEWCLDWYRSDYYSEADPTNPTGPEAGKQRVLRGGSFADDARALRAANRTAKEPGYREATVGFRCVRAVRQAHDARVLSGSKGVRAVSRDRPAGLRTSASSVRPRAPARKPAVYPPVAGELTTGSRAASSAEPRGGDRGGD